VREYPNISVELFAEDRLLNITQDGMDAGVRLGHVVSENMIAVPVSPSLRFAVVASPDYLQRSGHSAPRKPQDLLKHDCVAFRFPTSERAYSWEFEKNADVIRIDVNSNMAVDDMDVALDAVLNSAGIGYWCGCWRTGSRSGPVFSCITPAPKIARSPSRPFSRS
jgi:DNA-binding transcriptional LysR family regulator